MRALLVAGLLATGLCGQVINSQSRIVRTDANGNVKIGTRIPTLYTIGGTLPAAAAGNLGQVKTVSNAADYSDCTVGGGTTVHECYSTGAAWVAFGGTGALPAGVTSDGANGLTVMGNVQAATFSSPAPGDGSAGYSELVEGTAPASPAAGNQRLYIDSADHLLKRKNSAGTVTVLQSQMTLPWGCAVGDPAGSALSTGVLCYVVVPMAGTIVGWDIVADSGTATVDVWKIATGTAKPTVANTITASAKPAISSGTAIHSTTLTGWTTTVAANDIIGFNLDVAGPKYVTVNVQIRH